MSGFAITLGVVGAAAVATPIIVPSLRRMLFPGTHRTTITDHLPHELTSAGIRFGPTHCIALRIAGIDIELSGTQDRFDDRIAMVNSLCETGAKASFFVLRRPAPRSQQAVTDNLIDTQLSTALGKAYNTAHIVLITATDQDIVMRTANNIRQILAPYGPRLPRPPQQLRLVSDILNPVSGAPAGTADTLDDLVTDQLNWRDGPIFHYTTPSHSGVFAVLGLRNLAGATETAEALSVELQSITATIMITVSVNPLSFARAAVETEYHANQLSGSSRDADQAEQALEAVRALKSTTANRLGQAEIDLSIMVFARNRTELETALDEIATVATSHKLTLHREDIFAQDAYLSALPTQESTIRPKRFQANNIAAWVPFYATPAGAAAPVWRFFTSTGDQYRFAFLPDNRGENPAGHTAVIGATSAGKTGLLAQFIYAARSANHDVVAFDVRSGLRTLTLALGGSHIDVTASTPTLNPLLLPADDDHRDFLRAWCSIVTGGMTDSHPITIEDIIATLELDGITHADRRFDLLRDTVTQPSHPLFGALEMATLPLFAAESNAAINDRFTCLECAALLQQPALAEAFASLALHMLTTRLKAQPRPTLIIFDEAEQYLTSEPFKLLIQQYIRIIRGFGGIVILAFQRADAAADTGMLSYVQTQFENLFMFADPDGARSSYIDLELTQAEDQFRRGRIARRLKRPVLLRTRSGDRVVLETDLSAAPAFVHLITKGYRSEHYYRRIHQVGRDQATDELLQETTQ